MTSPHVSSGYIALSSLRVELKCSIFVNRKEFLIEIRNKVRTF